MTYEKQITNWQYLFHVPSIFQKEPQLQWSGTVEQFAESS